MLTTPHESESVIFLRIEDVLARVGLKKSKVYEMIRAGDFPAPVKIGASSLWPDTEVLGWQKDRMGERG